MIKFRNPGTQYSTHINIIKLLYQRVIDKAYFTLEDMSVAVTQGKLLTAYGYTGENALRLSNTEQESMNSTLMNVKMYAELFRMFGWITPYREGASYPLVFTFLGVHVALAEMDPIALYEQSVLGISNPTQFNDNMKYSEETRFFKCALRALIDLGGIMYKHELCIGPMSINDKNDEEYNNMISYIRSLRGDYHRLNHAFLQLADDLNMKTTSVDNQTRTPVGLMKNCGWIESVKNTSLYNKSLTCFRITEHGRQVYETISNYYDLRLDEYNSLEPALKDSIIRISTYSMLDRAGFDISPIQAELQQDQEACYNYTGGKELLFSASATIRRSAVERALGISFGDGTGEHADIDTFGSNINERELTDIQYWDMNITNQAALERLDLHEDQVFLSKVNQLLNEGKSNSEIVNFLFKDYSSATQPVFYPLISTLFKIMDFNCSFSRPGDNGARWDAIIDDPERSIPIEIKSPTEESHLSIKAIRQALENKIILLSRRTHATTTEVTSLAVGYELPNDRAEVSDLISAIKDTYGYSIGAIDLKTLLSIAISILVDNRGFDKELLFNLEGFVNANIQ